MPKMAWHIVVLAGASALSLAAISPPASAQTAWTGAQSPNWFNFGNWSTAAVPTGVDDVVLDTIIPNPSEVNAGNAAAQNLTVGDSGTGTLTIQNGGAVNVGSGGFGTSFIGRESGSTGTATVSGAGSTWTSAANLFVGYGGTGTLTVENGGQVSSFFVASIGELAGSTGSIIVTDRGSTLQSGGTIVVGGIGTGSLTVQDGGAVVDDFNGAVGLDARSSGEVTVTGAGSTWTTNGVLSVGINGFGMLTIAARGEVQNTNGIVGTNASAVGAVTVTGANSTWTNNGDLFVGDGGTGTLNVDSGGGVQDGNGIIGSNAGSTGTVIVTGPGSTWTNVPFWSSVTRATARSQSRAAVR